MPHAHQLRENQDRIVAAPEMAEADHVLVRFVEAGPRDEITQTVAVLILPLSGEGNQSISTATPRLGVQIGRFDTVLAATDRRHQNRRMRQRAVGFVNAFQIEKAEVLASKIVHLAIDNIWALYEANVIVFGHQFSAKVALAHTTAVQLRRR